ncbi:MAG: hypothetical protein NT027_05995 [Proteobacteria bacterium]|nr:hypothetical protein [Pseudomonadota bacterium]
MQKNLFSTVHSNTSGPCFLAISSSANNGFDTGRILSPRVMKWSEEVQLIDLSSTHRYWAQKAMEDGLTFDQMIERLIKDYFPPQTIGVIANHPWQAVLYLKTFSARACGTLLNLSSPFGRSLKKDLSWEAWSETFQEIDDHFLVFGSKSKLSKDKKSKSQLSTFLKTAQRMSLHTPAHFHHGALDNDSNETSGIKRRFGDRVATLWDWTWTQIQGDTNDIGFPWKTQKLNEVPSVQRLLIHPIRNWEHIEPILCEDLDRLCQLRCWNSSERVVSLEWELFFSNSPTLSIPVLFRYPHALHREIGLHKTALLQAFHSWTSSLSKRLKQSLFHEDSQYLENDAIIEWKVVVKERLVIPPQHHSLFADDLSSPLARLRDLENSLPVQLSEFAHADDWTPEDSWKIQSTNSEKSLSKACSESADSPIDSPKSYLFQHLCRPLFIQNEPTPFISNEQDPYFEFKERVMRKWWQLAVSDDYVYDCFLHEDRKGRLLWIHKSTNKQLTINGVYG